MLINWHEAGIRAIQGEETPTIPWIPRMDLWYIALRERGTLPGGLEDANVVDIAQYFGFGTHAVRADYTRPRDRDANMFRGLGYENHPDYPFRIELSSLPVDYSIEGEHTRTVVETPEGVVDFHLRYSASMRADGISQPFKLSYPVEELADLDAVASLFEHLEVIPAPDAYRNFHDRVGTSGLAVAHGSIAASPFHLLLHELMPMDRFFFWYHDHYDALKRFEERVKPFFERLIDAVAASGAEVALWGTNFDRDLTWPPFFAEDIAPWLMRVRDRFHEQGLKMLCHTDGENSGLFDSYRPVGFDVAESVCTAPMTELDLLTQRRGYGDEVTVWGGIPSVMLLADSTDRDTFEAYLARLGTELGELAPARSQLIIGVSDNVPPDCDLGRLRRVGEWIATV